jgi:hydrogenase expression/formation protein HypD
VGNEIVSDKAQGFLDRIRALPLSGKVKILNVCGGHERAISAAGIRGALPAAIELIPGPGCPVCICPEEDVYEAMQLALRERVTLLAFGDMLRVPVNVPRREPRTLEQARAAGADIRPVASPAEVVQIARRLPARTVVLFAAGFETTTAPVAAMLAQGAPANLFVLLSGRRTWPAVALLLESAEVGFDALIAPGHVATVMGPEEWEPVPARYKVPAAVAGFRADTLLAAICSVLEQLIGGRPHLSNCYPEAVRPGGNVHARRLLGEVMEVVDANWRGIGVIPMSGYRLSDKYAAHDARRALPSYRDEARKRMGEMPPGCDCARVVLGKLYPDECRLYGRACTPRTPIGPCMVSDEGACRIWWSSGKREPAARPVRAPGGSGA